MGLGNKLIVSATGFPGTNKTLRFIQDAFREPLGALAQLAGNKTIITGVVVDSSNPLAMTVSNGFISYNGEIIPFVGGSYADTVTIIESFENVNYNTDANDDTVLDSLPAYRNIYAKCGTGGIDIFYFGELAPLKTIKELSNFTLPANIVIDANYVHTDYNFTLAMLNHLNSIEFGAEANVQTDWLVTSPGSDAYLKNKPFTEIKCTHGSLVTVPSSNGYYQFNFTRNYVDIYPPTGFTIYHLKGFVPSIGEINFSGDVNGDDTLWCNYQVDYTNAKVRVVCNNSESRNRSIINYLAIWIK